MLFNYKALTKAGQEQTGTIEAANNDSAINALQRRGLVVVSVTSAEKAPLLERDISFLTTISGKDIVILSRQMSTMFEAQVSAMKTFRLLSTQVENSLLRKILNQVADDIQGGMPISEALGKHPKAFSDFYVNMVRAGEESGRLSETFLYLADYLERSYELTSKIRGALVYPAFVIFVFIAVMTLMLTVVVPKLSDILLASGQDIPVYTKMIIALSNFLVHYGFLFALGIVGFIALLWFLNQKRYISFAKIKLVLPLFGNLFAKLYLSRFSDNMSTMLQSGIPIVRSVEITGTIVGNEIYKKILDEAADSIKGGNPLSEALDGYKEFPAIIVQMIKVGEETGEIGNILKKMAAFYKREVDTTIDTLVSLIEPLMIVLLGLGVGTILAAVLMPIYNLSGAL